MMPTFAYAVVMLQVFSLRFAHLPDTIQDACAVRLTEVVTHAPVEESMVLVTCARVTVLFVGAPSPMITWLANQVGCDVTSLQRLCVHYTGRDALAHAMSLASGLESAVLGEPQILGQFKRAFASSKHCGPVLNHILPVIIQAAKAVRTETNIGASPLALSCIAGRLAKQVFSDIATTPIALIGTGDMVACQLAYCQQEGMQDVTVVSRSLERAARLVAPLVGKPSCMTQLEATLNRVDWVVSATRSIQPILGKGLMERVAAARRWRPMVLIDLAMPCDIEPEVASIKGVYYYSLAQLQALADANQAKREEAARDAAPWLAHWLAEGEKELAYIQHVSKLRQFRRFVVKSRHRATEHALAELARGKPASDVIERALYQYSQTLMHGPTCQLRQAATQHDHSLFESASHLFSLENQNE